MFLPLEGRFVLAKNPAVAEDAPELAGEHGEVVGVRDVEGMGSPAHERMLAAVAGSLETNGSERGEEVAVLGLRREGHQGRLALSFVRSSSGISLSP